jgi:N-acetylneuraminate synthase
VLGTGAKEVLEVENDLRGFARRSVFSARAIRAGETITVENIRVLRNGINAPGIPPSAYPRLLGLRAARDIPAGIAVTKDMITNAPPLS